MSRGLFIRRPRGSNPFRRATHRPQCKYALTSEDINDNLLQPFATVALRIPPGALEKKLMPSLIDIFKILSVSVAAAVLGNWFLSEFKTARRRNLPWYSAYLSPPGLLVLASLALPLLYWLAQR